jgi:hypothetical protein
MSVSRIDITPDTKPDTSTAPAGAKDGPNGSVLVDSTTTTPPGDKPGERPSWLPEKFKSPEEFARSYGELEKKLGQAKPADSATTTDTAITTEAAKKAGIDMGALSQEFSQNGELSAETLTSLEAAGFNKAAVDTYIAGQQALADKLTSELETVAGGKKQLAATLEWAKANMSADEIAAYNDAIDSGNLNRAKLALTGVVSHYTQANGVQPNLIEGGESARSTDVAPYESNAQIVKDMSSKEYKTDPAFRRKVERRLAVTGSFGNG